MADYIFPWLNGSEKIINPTIIKHGFAGGEFEDNISLGSFSVCLKLENEGGIWLVDLSGNTSPTDYTVEAIDIWVAATIEQYEV